MTETLLWQTLEDCFRRSDLTGIAALADEVALTDEALAETIRWCAGQPMDPKQWPWKSVWWSAHWWYRLQSFTGKEYSPFQIPANTLKEALDAVHQHRLKALDFYSPHFSLRSQ